MNWMSFLTYAMITAFTPGPNNIMSLTNATRHGLRRSYPFNLGIWAGFSIVMILCAVLTTTLHAVLPAIKTPMLILGAGYILYLAWKTFKSTSVDDEKNAKGGFLAGFLLQFINPKGIIYGIVSMEAFILPVYQGNNLALLGFALLLSTLGFVSTLCWAAFGSLFKKLFSDYRKTINTIMALLLVYCAVSLFL